MAALKNPGKTLLIRCIDLKARTSSLPYYLAVARKRFDLAIRYCCVQFADVTSADAAAAVAAAAGGRSLRLWMMEDQRYL